MGSFINSVIGQCFARLYRSQINDAIKQVIGDLDTYQDADIRASKITHEKATDIIAKLNWDRSPFQGARSTAVKYCLKDEISTIKEAKLPALLRSIYIKRSSALEKNDNAALSEADISRISLELKNDENYKIFKLYEIRYLVRNYETDKNPSGTLSQALGFISHWKEVKGSAKSEVKQKLATFEYSIKIIAKETNKPESEVYKEIYKLLFNTDLENESLSLDEIKRKIRDKIESPCRKSEHNQQLVDFSEGYLLVSTLALQLLFDHNQLTTKDRQGIKSILESPDSSSKTIDEAALTPPAKYLCKQILACRKNRLYAQTPLITAINDKLNLKLASKSKEESDTFYGVQTSYNRPSKKVQNIDFLKVINESSPESLLEHLKQHSEIFTNNPSFILAILKKYGNEFQSYSKQSETNHSTSRAIDQIKKIIAQALPKPQNEAINLVEMAALVSIMDEERLDKILEHIESGNLSSADNEELEYLVCLYLSTKQHVSNSILGSTRSKSKAEKSNAEEFYDRLKTTLGERRAAFIERLIKASENESTKKFGLYAFQEYFLRSLKGEAAVAKFPSEFARQAADSKARVGTNEDDTGQVMSEWIIGEGVATNPSERDLQKDQFTTDCQRIGFTRLVLDEDGEKYVEFYPKEQHEDGRKVVVGESLSATTSHMDLAVAGDLLANKLKELSIPVGQTTIDSDLEEVVKLLITQIPANVVTQLIQENLERNSGFAEGVVGYKFMITLERAEVIIKRTNDGYAFNIKFNVEIKETDAGSFVGKPTTVDMEGYVEFECQLKNQDGSWAFSEMKMRQPSENTEFPVSSNTDDDDIKGKRKAD